VFLKHKRSSPRTTMRFPGRKGELVFLEHKPPSVRNLPGARTV
jgi:hypothetical protein